MDLGGQLRESDTQTIPRGKHVTPTGFHVTATVDATCSATGTIVVTSVKTDRKYKCTSPLSKTGDTFTAGRKVMIMLNAETLQYEIFSAACE